MKLLCPLCNSSEILTKETVLREYINDLYKLNYGIIVPVNFTVFDYNNCTNCGLRYFYPLETGDEEFYEILQSYDWYYMSDKTEYSIALKYLSSFDSVLEVGAGKAAFADLVGKERYTGLEFNNKAIEKANAANINLIKESIEEHARKDFKYDAVVSFQVLEHVASPASFIKNCLGCLETGGMLILAVPSQDGFLSQEINNVLDMPPHHVTHWAERTLYKISELFGLSIVAIEAEPVAEYHEELARKVLVETRIRKLIGMKYHLIDRSFSARIISKLARIIVSMTNLSLDDTKGHTVVACYRKN